jgi:hypothetical protein
VRKLLPVLVLAACPARYVPDSMSPPVHRFGCVDVHVAAAWPSEATGPVAVIDLGNRCEHGVVVDLGALRAVAEQVDATGTTPVVLVPYDPKQEIRPRTLAPGAHGDEWIELHPVRPLQRIDKLVLDIAGIVPGETTVDHRVEVDVPTDPDVQSD